VLNPEYCREKARACEERANETSDFIRKELVWLAREWHELANRVEGSSVEPPSPPKHPPSPFSRLYESIKHLPPKEKQSRLREFFGIVGGTRPGKGRGRKGKRP
jgi:hypothetical protein